MLFLILTGLSFIKVMVISDLERDNLSSHAMEVEEDKDRSPLNLHLFLFLFFCTLEKALYLRRVIPYPKAVQHSIHALDIT